MNREQKQHARHGNPVAGFFQDRGLSLTTVVLVLFVVSLIQSSLSYTMALGGLRHLLPTGFELLAGVVFAIRVALLVLLVVLWIQNRKRALFRTIVVANTLYTMDLLGQVYYLLGVLAAISRKVDDTLILDVVLMAMANILIFSIWYWIIDPPGVEEIPREGESWDFLFPQRGSSLPRYESWVPRYADYLFVAFTTSFAFSPTDALPLTRRAKLLMMLQAAVSVVTIAGIAGGAINILVSGN